MATTRFVSFVREGAMVRLQFPAPLGKKFFFDYEVGSDVHAEMMLANVREMLGGIVEDLSRQMYDQGWRDAKGRHVEKGGRKAKRQKAQRRDWFPTWLSTER